MGDFPFAYERIAATTWAYMSSLLMLALFFKFNRFWSVRNFDLVLIILLAPGLLMIEGGQRSIDNYLKQQPSQNQALKWSQENPIADANREVLVSSRPHPFADESANEATVSDHRRLSALWPGYTMQRWGFYWLFGVGTVFLFRMLLDPQLARKPLLDPNLAIGGLVFFGLSLMVFLFANIVTAEPAAEDLRGARDAVTLLQRQAAGEEDEKELTRHGPGYRLFNLLPIIPSFNNGREIMRTDADDEATNMNRYVIAAKSLAIASQVLIVLGLILFSYYNYGNFNVSVGIATIYLMLPYTAIYTGHVLHALPAALMVWSLVCFRRPLLAGALIGMAIGVSYYPIFLLPLWASFYWLRGVWRFLLGVLMALAICILGLVFTSTGTADFMDQLQAMFGFWWPLIDGLEGIWALGWNQWYRLPILVAFMVLSVSFIFWPTEKNIGTLVSYSAAIMVAVQFWHGFGGGLYMAWYLPMVLLVFFRPNLNGRVAIAELKEAGWRRRVEPTENLVSAA
jgi:hypothetical protein